ncbi:TPA: hypothetical protein ACH3X2_001308 [Trebouxia sp. C0005]
MQARQHKAQSGKGALPSGAPLAFQLSSPSKIAKRNVLDAPAPKTLVSDALAGIAEDNATASGKVRPKKSRWGPDQPTGSPILPVASSGKPWPPASGFKGVTSHRPPGAPLLTKAAKQPDANALSSSKKLYQPAADLSNGKDAVSSPTEAAAASQVTTHHSPSTLDVSSGHYPQPDRLHHISSGDVHMASSKGRYSRSPTRDLSQVPSTELLRPFSRERSQSPSRTGVMPRDQMRVSIRENGYPREHFKGPGRNGKDCTDYARHDIAQNKRPRYNCHYQEYYEYDRGPVHSTDHDQMAATRREHDSCLASQTVPYVKQHDFSRRNDRSHRSSHRSDDNGGGRQPQRSRSHSMAPGGGPSGDRRKQERQARRRSPSHEEEGQITDRPATRSPILGKDAPKLPGQQLNRSPGQVQPQKALVSLFAHQLHHSGSHQKAVQEPASAPAKPAAAAAALPAASPSETADVQAQQLALHQLLQSTQDVDQTADLAVDPMSQPARPLQLDPAAVSLVKPLTPDASTISAVVATNNDFASLDPEATTVRAELQSNRTASAAQVDPCAAEHAAAAAGVAGVPMPDTAKASAAFRIVNDQRNQSDPDQAIPSSPRAKPVQRSSGEGRCRSLDKAAQQSPRTMRGRSRQAVEPHTQPCRVHRQCEDALPLSAHVLDRKRSQTPDTQTDRYAKRSRNDQRQPVVSSSQARVHGSRRAPPPSFREKQISSVEARRQASKLATLRPGEPRESNHSVSTRSRQHAVLPNDAYANRPSSESREPSVSMSPSPVHKRALQPHGPHPNRGQGGPAAPHLDDWQSDRWHNGDRDVVQGPGRLPSDLRQHGSFDQTSQLSSGDRGSSEHDAPHAGHRNRGTYHGHHSHDGGVPVQSYRNDRGHSCLDMDNGYSPHVAHVAKDLSCSDRHAYRASPPLTETDRHRQHCLSEPEQEAAARVRAQKLDWDTDQMMAKLLGAYGKPAEAIGDRQVLEAMREAVRVIGNMDEDNREASPGFLVTRQDLPEWLPDAKKQQVLNMLFPAAWLHQDPDFQPQWKLPLGWEPPECAGDGLRPHAEPLDSALQEGLQQVSHLQTNTVTVLLSREEAEAGGPGLDNSRDPRRRACSARPAQSLLLPMPLFPFLPHVEENICDSSSTSPDVIEGRTGGATAGPVDQLAPGGFLYDLWDMRHRAASPAGSWSTTPHTMASAGWGEARRPESASEWATSGHLEPPAAPSHTTNTEQQYTDHITTTAQPQWPPHEDSTGQQHGNMFEVQQQPHWQQQQDEAITPAAPSRVPTLQAPSAPQLQRPAYYPDPEPADYHIQFCDHMGLRTWSLATLRQDMRCGKGDALPNTPILNKAEGYWLPLREGRWLPDHLHWAGIDQMVMQGAAITSDAVTSAEAMSDAGLDKWVINTLASFHHQALPPLQLPNDMATAQHQHISTFATSACIGAAAEASDQDLALTTAAVSPSIEDAAALREVLASQHWFDSFDLPNAYEEQTPNISTSQSRNDGHGIGRGRSCWGPPPPPQYTAMLCGELSLAVMSGVAGKSLIKEVLDRAIQQELDKAKAN